MSPGPASVAFLFDVDNTLLDNDRVKGDLVTAIESLVGAERGRRFWELYEEVRHECDYVDFPRTLERSRCISRQCRDPVRRRPGVPARQDRARGLH